MNQVLTPLMIKKKANSDVAFLTQAGKLLKQCMKQAFKPPNMSDFENEIDKIMQSSNSHSFRSLFSKLQVAKLNTTNYCNTDIALEAHNINMVKAHKLELIQSLDYSNKKFNKDGKQVKSDIDKQVERSTCLGKSFKKWAFHDIKKIDSVIEMEK